MPIHKIQSVYTIVRDLDAQQAFYTRVLGIAPKFRDADRWSQFGIGNTNFALSSVAEAAPGAAGSVVVFEANHLDGLRELVVEAGGSFVAAREMGTHGNILSFMDPEGQPFQVFAKASPPPTPPSPASEEKGSTS
ncbi:glyoxalase [Bosea caraganae]|uniref:Glyoxalase n=1 Tax=Bosea caraganae TaxID=2763117 RepID=A0A370KZ75_9HYPH|nr:VOC family protein [Bosea caraganae]RDJ20305.1 glyoxalase [Bosea caraganae]RDJ24026.1 glyoxalase [Bosea caraganae]